MTVMATGISQLCPSLYSHITAYTALGLLLLLSATAAVPRHAVPLHARSRLGPGGSTGAAAHTMHTATALHSDAMFGSKRRHTLLATEGHLQHESHLNKPLTEDGGNNGRISSSSLPPPHHASLSLRAVRVCRWAAIAQEEKARMASLGLLRDLDEVNEAPPEITARSGPRPSEDDSSSTAWREPWSYRPSYRSPFMPLEADPVEAVLISMDQVWMWGVISVNKKCKQKQCHYYVAGLLSAESTSFCILYSLSCLQFDAYKPSVDREIMRMWRAIIA